MLVETLRADWSARGANARVSTLPEFDGGALTFGFEMKTDGARGGARAETMRTRPAKPTTPGASFAPPQHEADHVV